MLQASNTVVGVDFGAPQRARDQRRKIIATEARAIDWQRYRVDATGRNERLLARDPPGWTAMELRDELLERLHRFSCLPNIRGSEAAWPICLQIDPAPVWCDPGGGIPIIGVKF